MGLAQCPRLGNAPLPPTHAPRPYRVGNPPTTKDQDPDARLAEEWSRTPASCTLSLWLECDRGAGSNLLCRVGRARHAGRPLRDDRPARGTAAAPALPPHRLPPP